jgi:hypothetical protein
LDDESRNLSAAICVGWRSSALSPLPAWSRYSSSRLLSGGHAQGGEDGLAERSKLDPQAEATK